MPLTYIFLNQTKRKIDVLSSYNWKITLFFSPLLIVSGPIGIVMNIVDVLIFFSSILYHVLSLWCSWFKQRINSHTQHTAHINEHMKCSKVTRKTICTINSTKRIVKKKTKNSNIDYWWTMNESAESMMTIHKHKKINIWIQENINAHKLYVWSVCESRALSLAALKKMN